MKHLTCLAFFLLTTVLNAQKNQSVISFSTEFSGGTDFINDYWDSFYRQFEVQDQKNIGFNLSFDHLHHFKGRTAMSFGLGFNSTFFNHEMTFQNFAVPGFNPTPDTQSFSHSNYFLALDLPVRYYLNFKVAENVRVMPYVGLKIRNILYIGSEGRNTTVRSGVGVWEDNETFVRKYDLRIEYSTTESRVLFHPHFGLQFSSEIQSDHAINFFCDYNLGTLLNFAEIEYKNFKNAENNVFYGYPEDRNVRFRVKNAHLRFGVSYSL